MKKLFTEVYGDAKPRVEEALDDATREGLLTLVSARIDEEWFGLSFNEKCGDGYAYAGTDLTRLGKTISYEFIAEAKNPTYHSYMSHSHYSYDREAGRAAICSTRQARTAQCKHGRDVDTLPRHWTHHRRRRAPVSCRDSSCSQARTSARGSLVATVARRSGARRLGHPRCFAIRSPGGLRIPDR